VVSGKELNAIIKTSQDKVNKVLKDTDALKKKVDAADKTADDLKAFATYVASATAPVPAPATG
jgi:hypothetical protein